jgi:hypothetical protein
MARIACFDITSEYQVVIIKMLQKQESATEDRQEIRPIVDRRGLQFLCGLAPLRELKTPSRTPRRTGKAGLPQAG